MKNRNEIVIAGICGAIIIGFSSYVVIATNAQIEPVDKFFEKDFCQAENTLLDGILYTNGNELSYDSSGCPISVKVIHDWDNISTVNQNIIRARMSTNGYSEVVTSALEQR